jgi:peptide subunit release factor 1 (eRF1)
MAKTHHFGRQAEATREKQLVDTLISAAAKQEGAVVGLDETLAAAHAGNVRILIVADGLRAPGYRCDGCGYLSSQPTAQCPFCGASVKEVEDSIEMAIQQVLLDGGEVEIPETIGALAGKDGIGALLRYPISTTTHSSP